MKRKLRRMGLGAILLAVLCWSTEAIFFAGLTEDGILRETFLLPLGYILGAVGLVMIALSPWGEH